MVLWRLPVLRDGAVGLGDVPWDGGLRSCWGSSCTPSDGKGPSKGCRMGDGTGRAPRGGETGRTPWKLGLKLVGLKLVGLLRHPPGTGAGPQLGVRDGERGREPSPGGTTQPLAGANPPSSTSSSAWTRSREPQNPLQVIFPSCKKNTIPFFQ